MFLLRDVYYVPLCVHGCLWEHAGIRDVSKWSARMRQPMEELYGAEVFAKTWEAWVDGIAQFAKRPEGTTLLLHSYYTEVKLSNLKLKALKKQEM